MWRFLIRDTKYYVNITSKTLSLKLRNLFFNLLILKWPKEGLWILARNNGSIDILEHED